MEFVKITKEDKEQYLILAKEENIYLKKFASYPVYQVPFSKEMSEKFFKRNLREERFFYGIKVDGKLVALIDGCTEKAPKGDVGYINDFFVTKKHRGNGFASILRKEFYKWLKKKGLKYCQLHVLKDNPALKIYEKWGYTIDEFKMTKKL